MTNEGQTCVAESVHAGNSCINCGREIRSGDEIVICGKCATISHARCWNDKGCLSFYCSNKTRNEDNLIPDFVISKSQVASIVAPPKGRVFTSESIAKEIESKDSGTNIFGIVCLLFGILSFGMGLKFVSNTGNLDAENVLFFFATILSGFITVILSITALAVGKKREGFIRNLPTLIGLVCGAFSMGMGLLGIGMKQEEEKIMIPRFESTQIKKFIEKAAPNIQRPLMANVLVTAGSFMREGAGSGVVLQTRDGFAYIVSNLHVVTLGKMAKDISQIQKNSKVLVTFFTGEERNAEPIWLGADGLDIVVLKAAMPKNLSISAKVQKGRFPSIGERVFAIGNPMGLNWSFTEGVISAIRPQLFGTNELPLLQMQTPLNHGNSGGGLYDQEGYLIGINTWIYSKTVSEGLNFSIAMDGILNVLDPSIMKLLDFSKGMSDGSKENERKAEAPTGGSK